MHGTEEGQCARFQGEMAAPRLSFRLFPHPPETLPPTPADSRRTWEFTPLGRPQPLAGRVKAQHLAWGGAGRGVTSEAHITLQSPGMAVGGLRLKLPSAQL